MRYIGRQPDERVTSQIARDVCEREGFKAMLSGSITSLGSRYVIALSAVNCSTGDALGLEQVEADEAQDEERELGDEIEVPPAEAVRNAPEPECGRRFHRGSSRGDAGF